MAPKKERSVRIRRARQADVPQIYACQEAAYQNYGSGGLCDQRLLTLVDVPVGPVARRVGEPVAAQPTSRRRQDVGTPHLRGPLGGIRRACRHLCRPDDLHAAPTRRPCHRSGRPEPPRQGSAVPRDRTAKNPAGAGFSCGVSWSDRGRIHASCGRSYRTWTSLACGPFWPSVTLKLTRWPSSRLL